MDGYEGVEVEITVMELIFFTIVAILIVFCFCYNFTMLAIYQGKCVNCPYRPDLREGP